MMTERSEGEKELMDTQGYCVVPGVLSADMLERLRKRFSREVLANESPDVFGESGAFLVADYHDPTVMELLTWPSAWAALRSLGYTAPKLHSFYVSTKPPGTTALAWHSDLFYRYEAVLPAELFLIYYLQDTVVANGCLRVVPGSHRWSHEMRQRPISDAGPRSDEVDVPVRAGDLFIGDRRLLHATHPNRSRRWRTCVTIACAPQFEALPESVQARIVQNRCLPPAGWWTADSLGVPQSLRPLLPVYTGSAQPIAMISASD